MVNYMGILADATTGMAGMVSALTSGSGAITSENLWSEATNAAPLITTIFIFAFGYFIVRRVLKGGSHGKLKV